ncbi:uncharacterized protein [Triticum aestivum]|uniref:uncharacterized protein n=1 Tax=Triticum aestivum TaxID=4565 RepID=UPI001D00349C|nr:uncharacterized protein LOC123050497 [Triticum aestivum]
MASSSSSSSARSSRIATCLVLVLLVVSLREASAGRPLRPARDVSSDSELKDQAIVDKYAPLLPTMLPRGLAPPSAPSGGTNEAGN